MLSQRWKKTIYYVSGAAIAIGWLVALFDILVRMWPSTPSEEDERIALLTFVITLCITAGYLLSGRLIFKSFKIVLKAIGIMFLTVLGAILAVVLLNIIFPA